MIFSHYYASRRCRRHIAGNIDADDCRHYAGCYGALLMRDDVDALVILMSYA